MNFSQIIASLKLLLPGLEPVVAAQVDGLLQKAEAAIDAKIGSPDWKLAADLLMAAIQHFADAEMAKVAVPSA